ncbi:O-antigen ligase family protein [Caulobacter sp. DWR2-3-1b2]|uniref:O-antigen ligase family protein n=1 Tax=unclassified Caulobacter TaxID=2648921 RepID=UPI003CED97D0
MRRRRASRRRTASSTAALGPKILAGLTLFPAGLCVFHLTAGANSVAAALWLTLAMALALSATLLALWHGAAGADAPSPRTHPLITGAFATTLMIAGAGLILPGGRSGEILGDAVSHSLSVDQTATLVEIVKLAGLACAFLIGCLQGGAVKRALATSQAVVFSGAVFALIGVFNYLSGEQVRTGNRLAAGFMSANSAATLFGMLLVIAVALLVQQGGSWRSLDRHRLRPNFFLLTASIAVLGASLLLTASRMGFVATGVALAVMAWQWARSRKAPLPARSALWIGTAALTCLALLAGADVLWERFGHIDDDAVNRGVIFVSHWRAFLASPAFGYGLGSFPLINNVVMTPETYSALWSIRAAHNVYIQWLEEAGVVGAAPMFVCIGACLWTAVKSARQRSPERLFLDGLIAADIVVLLHGLTDYSLQVPSIAATWAFLLGLQVALVRRPASDRAAARGGAISRFGRRTVTRLRKIGLQRTMEALAIRAQVDKDSAARATVCGVQRDRLTVQSMNVCHCARNPQVEPPVRTRKTSSAQVRRRREVSTSQSGSLPGAPGLFPQARDPGPDV